MKRELLKAHGALLAVALIYGLNYLLAKDVMKGFLDPREFILIRAIGATGLFWLFASFTSNGETKIERKDLGRMALAGLFGVAANQMFFFEGLNLTTPINASIIMTINPVLVLLLSAIILKDPLSPLKIIGIAVGATGAILLISQGGSANLFAAGEGLGNLLVLLNALSYGLYLVVVKPLMAKYSPLQVIKYVFLFGLLYVIPFSIHQVADTPWEAFDQGVWLKIAFVVVFTTFFAYLLNIYAMKTVASTTVSIYIYLQPFFATTFSLWAGVDTLDWTKVISAVFIFAGVGMVSYRKSTKKLDSA